MLQNWAMTVKSSQLLSTLRGALKRAGLVEVGDTCIPKSLTGEHDALPDEVSKLRQQLKSRYRKTYSKINTSPIDPGSRTWLQHIFVSLILMVGSTWDTEEEIDYDSLLELFTTESEEGFSTRIALIGEAGVGKSTLFAKIALDWAEGKILQEIDLLFLESFREIEESKYFGQTIMNHFPDDMEMKGQRIDEYISKNQRKVLILLDGLDEAKIDIKKSNRNNSVVSIVRGERFVDTSVLITSRPHGVDQIKSARKIHEQYKYVQVQGFTPENMQNYIKQFFQDDSKSASTLIQFVYSNKFVADHMAPIPIFCCMLCYMWKAQSRRETLLQMKTLPQLLKRLVFSLQEQYCSKHSDDEGGYDIHLKKAADSLKEAGRVAFQGLLVKQLIFDEEAIGSEEGIIACEVGILSKEKRLAPIQIRESQGKQFIVEFSFPHKLLQEYVSSFYLASLFDDDRSKFDRILTDKLLKNYQEFRFVLYFTAAIGGNVGKLIMEALCEKVDDIDFVLGVAYECHDAGSIIDSVRYLLKTKTNLEWSRIHRTAALIFTLETLGKEIRNRLSSDDTFCVDNPRVDRGLSLQLASVGLFTLQNLRSLELGYLVDEDFYKGMCEAALLSKIEVLKHKHAHRFVKEVHLGPAASSHYAKGICSMPNLRSLELENVHLADGYYSTLADEASRSKIEVLKHGHGHIFDREIHLGPAASSDYAIGICAMPNLRSLEMENVHLTDEFYSTMADKSSSSKIEVLKHYCTDTHLGPAASSNYAKGIFSMSNLRSLELENVHLTDEYYSTMAAEASRSKIKELKHGNHIHGYTLDPVTSSHYARGLFSMSKLQSLELVKFHLNDEFYSIMETKAPTSQIQKIRMTGTTVTQHSLQAILSLPCLQSLSLTALRGVDVDDESMPIPPQSSSVELAVDVRHVESLWKLGLHTSCSLVNKLELHCDYTELDSSSDLVSIACSPFILLSELHIVGRYRTVTLDPMSFCNAVKTSCPQLTDLSITRVKLNNEKATKIILSMKILPHLTRITMERCYTDQDLDPLIDKVNSEGHLILTVKHDPQSLY